MAERAEPEQAEPVWAATARGEPELAATASAEPELAATAEPERAEPKRAEPEREEPELAAAVAEPWYTQYNSPCLPSHRHTYVSPLHTQYLLLDGPGEDGATSVS